MRVLLLGSGGREHAIAWKISQSSILDELFIAPGNAGTKKHGKNLDLKLTDFEAIKQGIEGGAPERESWRMAFGLLVTLVWIYLEFLRLIAIFSRN